MFDDEIKKYDEDFDLAHFYTKVDHIFTMILSAIMERDTSNVKHYLSNEIYEDYNKLINSYIEDKKIRLFDEMNVKSTDIIDVYKNNYGINIVVKLVSRYMDYFIDEEGKYINGINDHRIEVDHEIVFTKKLDTKELKEVRKCPSCGNSLDINVTGVCPYCKQTIDMSNYDYIVTKITKI